MIMFVADADCETVLVLVPRKLLDMTMAVDSFPLLPSDDDADDGAVTVLMMIMIVMIMMHAVGMVIVVRHGRTLQQQQQPHGYSSMGSMRISVAAMIV